MSPYYSRMVDAAYYRDLLRPIFHGRRMVIIGLPLAGATYTVKQLRALGSERLLVIGSGPGTGPFPDESDAEWLVLEHRSTDIMAELHGIEQLMASPPPAVVAAIERYDPERVAMVLAPIVTLGPIPAQMAGRPVWGRRPPASLPLEEKTRIDAFWDRLGVERAPSVVAPVSIDAIIGAQRRMDRGAGTVMAGDARDGLHGGAHLVRWIRSDDDLRHALEVFGQYCDRVRVMPFLEGIPCSIHGLVFAGHSVALRPVELVTLRPREGFRFLYAGAATYWDPSERDREYMRSVGRRVADAYRGLVGTGCFTVDGVMTEDGWLPTELNPRFGAGISVMARGLPDIPLVLLCQALQAGEALEYRPAEFETWLLSAADAHRSGGGWTTINTRFDTSQEHQLVRSGESYRLATADEAADGTFLIGPSNVGGFIRFTPDPARTEIGPSIAPAVVAAFALADREFGTNIGPLDPARPVRS
jgi:hypothetical protein